MKIHSTAEETLVRRTTVIDMDDGSAVVCIDYVNDNGNVVDSVYRDEATGYEIDDPTAVEEIEAFMAEQLLPEDE